MTHEQDLLLQHVLELHDLKKMKGDTVNKDNKFVPQHETFSWDEGSVVL